MHMFSFIKNRTYILVMEVFTYVYMCSESNEKEHFNGKEDPIGMYMSNHACMA